nr:hypothetical protein [Radiobacillus kanasensis]
MVSEFEHLYIFWKPGETVIDRNKLTKKNGWNGEVEEYGLFRQLEKTMIMWLSSL